MKRGMFALLLILTFPCLTKGQDTLPEAFRGAELWAGYGVHLVDIAAFNRAVGSRGLPGFEREMPAVSLGGGVFMKQIYFGGQASIQPGLYSSDEHYETKLSGGHGMLEIGYVIMNSSTFNFYPTLGLGGGGVRYRVSQKDNDPSTPPVSFAGEKLHSGYMVIDPTLNVDLLTKGGESPSGLMIGISFGYLLPAFNSSWEYDDQHVDLEKFAPEGFHAGLRIGWHRGR